MKWTTVEDSTVTNSMLDGIENRVSLRSVAEQLSNQMSHSADAILRRWYTVLSDGTTVKQMRQNKVPFNTRLDPDVANMIRTLTDQGEYDSQGALIEMLVRRHNDTNNTEANVI